MNTLTSSVTNSVKHLPGGIVHIRFSSDNLISFDLLREIRSVVNELQEGPVEGFLITLPDFPQAEPRFWKKLRRLEYYMQGKPTAVICPGTGLRLLAQGYQAIYNPKHPYRIFKSFDCGYEWLSNPEYRDTLARLDAGTRTFALQ